MLTESKALRQFRQRTQELLDEVTAAIAELERLQLVEEERARGAGSEYQNGGPPEEE